MADIDYVRFRFDQYVGEPNENGCRLWLGGKNSTGYGSFTIRPGGGVGAHVVAWRFAHGWRRVPKGRVIRHRCDVPACVEPTHLVSGTTSQNIKESYTRGGRKPPRARDLLTAGMVREGRRLCDEGRLSQRELATLWGVTPPVVSNIMRRKSYVGESFGY